MAQEIYSIVDRYMFRIAQFVKALARKAKGPGSSPGPGYNFSLSNSTSSQQTALIR